MSPKEQADTKRGFLAAIRQSRTTHFEKGSIDEESILADAIQDNAKLWKLLEPILAREAALEMVRRVIKGTPLAFDGPQEKLFEDLPPRIVIQSGGWKPIDKATVKELLWYTSWYELRLHGNIKRSERDNTTLERLRRVSNIVERYGRKTPDMTIEAALIRAQRRRR